MSFVLIHGGHHLLGATGPLIKASEADAVSSAAQLLERAERILADAQAEAEELRATARQQALAEVTAEVRAEVAERLTGMARDLASEQRRRDEELAEAAMAAVKAMLGSAAPEVIGPALVRQALASFAEGRPVELHVAPSLAARLEAELADDPQVRLVEDPQLGPLDCELCLASGTIRAGMAVQLAALAERWGLPPEAAR